MKSSQFGRPYQLEGWLFVVVLYFFLFFFFLNHRQPLFKLQIRPLRTRQMRTDVLENLADLL